MKKKLSFIFATVFALSGFAACKKDDPTVTQTRSGWLLSAPAYMDGTLSFNAYQTGMGLDLDPQNTVGEMQVITQTSREGFDTYLTKVTKNGSTMAYLTLEDRFAEIEIVVFAKQYASLYSELYTDNAVCIIGNIAAEEGEEPQILLSSVERLVSNADYQDTSSSDAEKKSTLEIQSAYIIYAISATIWLP